MPYGTNAKDMHPREKPKHRTASKIARAGEAHKEMGVGAPSTSGLWLKGKNG